VELRHLRYFIAVAEELNFSRAAQQLHIAQPPLSRQIRQLEDEIGAQLFTRNKRRVELTEPGRVFLDEARKLLAQAVQATELARKAQNREEGSVRVGIASGLGGLVSQVIAELARSFPAINVHCRDVFSSLQNEALRKGEIDVGFMRPPVDQLSLQSEVLLEEDFFVVLPRSHPLARRKSVRLAEIAGEPLIIFDRSFSTGLYDRILGLYRKQGLSLKLTVAHIEAHEEAGTIMVASGKGIYIGVGAIVTRSVSGVDVAVVKLNEPEAKIEVHAAWRKGEESAAILSFLDSARRVVGALASRGPAYQQRSSPAWMRTPTPSFHPVHDSKA
jgi:DNA-binding transcriptional LysR family regulator